jgi:hypothetical protein
MMFFKKHHKKKFPNVVIDHLALMIPCMAVIAASFVISPEQLEKRKGIGKVVPQCMFKQITGWPCPSCGMSRAFCSISRGEFKKAAEYNILSFVLYPAALSGAALSLASLLTARLSGAAQKQNVDE